MRATDLAGARWIKSSHSTNNGTCVELARHAGRIAARDSKNPDGPVLAFTPIALRACLDVIRR